MKLIFYKDDQLCENNNIEIHVHKMTKDKSVFPIRKLKYESKSVSTGHYIHLIKHNNKYSIYYPCEIDKSQYTAYAESNTDDNFVRPSLNKLKTNIIPNSIVLENSYACHNFNVFIDKNGGYRAVGGIHGTCSKTDMKAKKIYNYLFGCKAPGVSNKMTCDKFIYLYNSDYIHPKKLNGLYLYESINGTDWELSFDKPMVNSFMSLAKGVKLGTHGFDTQNKVIYNPVRDEYIAFTRGNMSQDIRHIFYSTSKDLLNWKPFNSININPKFNINTDSMYLSGAYLYPESGMYIAFPTYFKSNINNGNKRALYGNMLLMFSDNGSDWTTKDEYFRRDTHIKDDFDIRYRYDIAGFLLSECRTLFNIYIHENTFTMKNAIVKYTIRKDGFTSLYSKNGYCIIDIENTVINKLTVNYKTNKNGYIKISLINNKNEILYSSHKLTGNEIEKFININTLHISSIKIEINDAHLYALDY
jgi:hypothetical protein